MGSLNNRRLYAAVLGIAAVGFVLDRTVFSDAPLGPEAAKAELTSPARTAGAPAAPREPEPDRSAVLALVEKLRTIEQSGPIGPPSRSDAFALNHSGTTGIDAASAPGNDPAEDGSAAAFRKSHRLRAVLVPKGGVSRVMVDNDTLVIGEELDGFTLESIDAKKGSSGAATFVSGTTRVELIVPTGSGRPRSGGNGAPDSPPAS